MIQPRPQNEFLLPAKRRFIALSLLLALFANLLPWSGWLLAVRPDFIAVVLLYWCLYQPRKIGFTTAMAMGLLMDVVDGTLFGQHALAYSVLAYAGIVLHRRIQRFSMRNQALQVIALLLMNDVIVLAVRMMGEGGFPGIAYFTGAFISGALWPVLVHVLTLPQRPKAEPDYA